MMLIRDGWRWRGSKRTGRLFFQRKGYPAAGKFAADRGLILIVIHINAYGLIAVGVSAGDLPIQLGLRPEASGRGLSCA